MYCFKYTNSTHPTFCSVHNLLAIFSSLAPADISLYHRVDYPALTYSVSVRGNSRDVLLHSMLMGEIIHRCKEPFYVLFYNKKLLS